VSGFCPDYIGIGFRRCATSWLHQMLYEHPQVGHYRGSDAWGMHFFSSEANFSQGIDHYERQIAAFSNNGQVSGELSDSYTYPEVAEIVAERISALYPRAKLFCIVRNPVDRLMSDYRRSILRSEIPKDMSLDEALEADPRFLQRGLYASLLKPFMKFHAKGRLLILVNEDIRTDPQAVVRRLYEYLGVDGEFTPPSLMKQINKAGLFGGSSLAPMIRFADDVFGALLSRFRLGAAVRCARNVIDANGKTSVALRDGRFFLQEVYDDDIVELSNIMGRDLKSVWQT